MLFSRFVVGNRSEGAENNVYCLCVLGENTVNGDHSDAHHSTFSQSSKEVCPHDIIFVLKKKKLVTCTIYIYVHMREREIRKVSSRNTRNTDPSLKRYFVYIDYVLDIIRARSARGLDSLHTDLQIVKTNLRTYVHKHRSCCSLLVALTRFYLAPEIKKRTPCFHSKETKHFPRDL